MAKGGRKKKASLDKEEPKKIYDVTSVAMEQSVKPVSQKKRRKVKKKQVEEKAKMESLISSIPPAEAGQPTVFTLEPQPNASMQPPTNVSLPLEVNLVNELPQNQQFPINSFQRRIMPKSDVFTFQI